MNPDAEAERLATLAPDTLLTKVVLDLHREPHSGCCVLKDREHAVAGGIHNAAAIVADQPAKQAERSFEPLDRSHLIGTHHARIAVEIGKQDGGVAPLRGCGPMFFVHSAP